LQRDFHLRVQLRKLRQRRHQRPPRSGRAGHAQQAAHLLLVLVGQLFDIAQRALDLACLLQHLVADLGQRQLAGGALDQARAQFFFQLGQLARYHRFADA
jgi:hypothetical protein